MDNSKRKASKAQIEYIGKYNAKTYVQFTVRVRRDDAEGIKLMRGIKCPKGKSRYILDAIKEKNERDAKKNKE